MAKEKRFIIFQRIFWAVLLLLGALLPTIIEWIKPDLEIVNYECFITDYDEATEYSNGYTFCEIEIEFNRAVKGCNAEIDFFDVDGNYLGTENIYCYADGKFAYDDYIYIDGCVDSYNLVSWSADYSKFWYPYLSLIISVPVFIGALMLRYREIDYEGSTISVYAGFCEQRLTIDGEVVDVESDSCYDTGTTYLQGEIYRDEDDFDIVEVKIFSGNEIVVKINNKIV